MERVAVIDYGAGNLCSIENIFLVLGVQVDIVRSPEKLRLYDRVCFPGVGEARAAMENIRASGMDRALCDYYRSGRPLLGICVGAQVLLTSSEERDAACLNLISGTVRRFESSRSASAPSESSSDSFEESSSSEKTPPAGSSPRLNIPQIGWNSVEHRPDTPLFENIRQGATFYFLHSYYPVPADADVAIAWSRYGIQFAAALRQENLYAVQFHPEKSGKNGVQLLDNFLKLS